MKKLFVLLGVLLSLSIKADVLIKQDGRYVLKSGPVSLQKLLSEASSALGMNLLLHQSIIDRDDIKIFLNGGGSVNKETLVQYLHTILRMHGFALLYFPNVDLYSVQTLREAHAREGSLPVLQKVQDVPSNDQVVSFVHVAQHVPAAWLSKKLRNFFPIHSRVVAEEESQVIVMTDSASNLKKRVQLIESFDTLENAKAAEQELQRSQNEQEEKGKKIEQQSAPLHAGQNGPTHQNVFHVLFGLIGLVIGLIARGYLAQRMEGDF